MLNKIRSLLILKTIFKNLRQRLKLKILKCNKNLLFKLNIKLKDFQDYELLNGLNKKFNLNIRDTDIKILELNNKENINEILEYIVKINFRGIIELSL